MQKKLLFKKETLVYELRGKGLPVMLLHGFTEDHRIFHPLMDDKDGKYLWILPDIPGSGQSSFNPGLGQMADFVEMIPCIMEQENIPELTLIGHSMGGYIALAFAKKFPDKIRALGLFHSTSYPDSEEKKESRDKNILFIKKNGTLPFLKQGIPSLFTEKFKTSHPEVINELITRCANFLPESLVQYLEAMKNRPLTREVLETITKPVLFIMGTEDKAVPLKDALEQCHLPRISYIHILTHSAHMGMIEETSLCKTILNQFLEQIPV